MEPRIVDVDASKDEWRDLRRKIESVLNSCSAENGCDTPDFILADYLVACLEAFDAAVRQRRTWWGDKEKSGFDFGGPAPHPKVPDAP